MAKSFLIYSPTGVGKTTQLAEIAKWVYETTGKTTRVITSDMGGIGPIEREGLIAAKIVSHFNAAGDNPKLLANWRKLSRGWWPKVELEMVEQKDSDGCITGPAIETKVNRLREDKLALSKVGLYCIEGATSTSDQLMRHLVKQEVTAEDGKVQAIGPQGASGRYEEDGEVLGGNSKGHFNIVQVEMHGLFSAFSALPDHVLVGWTAHEGLGLIKKSGESCYCPQLAGGAKNHMVPSWVGDCFHLDLTPEIRDGEGTVIQPKKVRAFFVNHTDADGELQYLCKSRVGVSDIAPLQERFPGGFVELGTTYGKGLDQYFRWLDERKGGNTSELMKWKATIDAKRDVAIKHALEAAANNKLISAQQ